MTLLLGSNLAKDIAFSFRLLRRRPLGTLLAVAALALGVGLSTAMFSILWGTVLRGLPFEDGDRLVRIETVAQGQPMSPSETDLLLWRRGQRSFDELAAWLGGSFNLSGPGLDAVRCNGAYVSANLFTLTRTRPLLGRGFLPEEEAPGAPLVAILSAELWRKHFGSAPDVLGRPIRLNGQPAQVIGVMPEGFEFPLRQEIWVPLQLAPEPSPQGQGLRVQVLGKLKEGTSSRQGEAELQAASAAQPGVEPGIGVRVTPFISAYTEDLQPTLFLLFGASLGLLLVVSVNVSGLLNALTVARLPELAVRGAMGATRRRLLTQLMTETAVLGLLGAILSVPLAAAAVRAYLVSQGGELRSFWMDVRLDGPAMAYSLAITAVVSLIATVIPSRQVTGPRLHQVLQKGTVRAVANPSGVFVGLRLTLQLALCVALLAATGLLLASLERLGRLEFGSAPEEVLTAQLLLPSGYSTPGERLRFFGELERRLEATLGPGQVAFASALPGNALDETEVEIEGQDPLPAGQARKAPYLIVSRGYFRVLGMRPLQGRLFESGDHIDGQPVAVVNESFVRRYLGSGHAVGRRFRFLSPDGPGVWRSIIGVVPDLVLGQASDTHSQGVYLSLEQVPTGWMAILARTPVNPRGFAPFLARTVAAIDREIPVFWVSTLQERIDQVRLPLKTMAQVFLTFGVSALLLALLGVYGVTAESVISRSREMAIRLALGGRRSDLLRRISSRTLIPVLAGVALGILLSFWSSRLLASVLFGLHARQPAIFLIAGATVTVAGLAACLVPSSRILRLPAGEALRSD